MTNCQGKNEELYYELYTKYKALNSRNKQEKKISLPPVNSFMQSHKALTPKIKFKDNQSPVKRHDKSTSYIIYESNILLGEWKGRGKYEI